MKVLLTGMASSHTSAKANKSNFGFFGVLNDALTTLGYDVSWESPSVAWTKDYLEQFDSIFVGIIPPTSVSANKAYGALSIIELMYNSPKLKLVVDSPQQWQIEPSLNSVVNDPKSLVKPFYCQRSEYLTARHEEVLQRLIRACKLLLTESWPITIYPSLPWKEDESVASNLPSAASSSLLGFNFDTFYSKKKEKSNHQKTEDFWTCNNLKTKWSQKVIKTINHPVRPLRAKKSETDEDVIYNLSHSIGVLMSPQERSGGTWWSFTYIQAVNQMTPVATEWRESSEMSPHWSYLPYQIESMGVDGRYFLAYEQRQSYLSSIPSVEESLSILKNLVKTTIKE